jgi:hypothetical protein
MKIKNFLTAAAAAATLLVAGSGAASAGYWHNHHYYCSSHDRDCDGRRDNSWGERHDYDGYKDNRRFDRRVTRSIIAHDRVYAVVRAHHYRYIGAPYWYRGYYGVRAYDPYGKVVFVRVDPYAGSYLGVAFRF